MNKISGYVEEDVLVEGRKSRDSGLVQALKHKSTELMTSQFGKRAIRRRVNRTITVRKDGHVTRGESFSKLLCA